MAVLVSVVMPAAWWTMVAGVTGAVVLAVILVVARRHIKVKGSSGTDPHILFRAVPPDDEKSNGGQRDYPITRLRNYPIHSIR